MNRGTCKACHAEVIWARTEAGKLIPVDPLPEMRGLLRQEAGQVFYTVEPTYLTHFATCPEADEMRRPTHRFVPTLIDGQCGKQGCEKPAGDHYATV